MTLGRSLAAIIHPTLSILGCITATLDGLAYEGDRITRSLLQFVPLINPSLLYSEAILSPQRQDSARVHGSRSKRTGRYSMGATPDYSMIRVSVHGDVATNIAIGNTFVSE